jgi:preprotein translocase subunit SecA
MAERRKILDTAQHISEGLRLDRHRSTWRYNRAISRQRDTVAARREEALTDDAGMTELRRRIPEHMDGLVSATSEAAVAETVRAVVLHRLDEHWRDHLALLADIRDGIHLRALAGQNPADEFHRIALREFDGFFDEAHGAAADFVARLTPSDIGRDPAELGLRRPSATWTYMVSDNPLGNPLDRAARRLGALWRGRVLRIE